MSTKRQKIYRVIAAYLLLNLLAEYFMPVAAFALTNGPGQPEFQSFEPAGSSEMVNLFTGDFSYNIPLMTVPGPNGGYPINLAYHAGIGMEQEASWCGLGWNINAGAINRSMRGLPDDFNGDQVIKKLHFEPSVSAVFGFGQSIAGIDSKNEILGFNFQVGSGVQVYYNNYRGVGFQFSGNLALATAGANADPEAYPLRLNLTSSSDGIGVNVQYSVVDKVERAGKEVDRGGLGGSISWGSREGIKALTLSGYRNTGLQRIVQTVGAGVSFTSSGYVPSSNPEIDGFVANVALQIGSENNFIWDSKKATSINASYNQSWIKNTTQPYSSYGYLYNEYSNAIYDKDVLEDINRDKDVPPTRQTKSLGVPSATYDMFSVSAQGMGGTFRPYRSDLGIYTEPRVTSTIYGGSVGLEWGAPKVGTSWVKFGADGSYIQSQTYSGMWFNHFWVGSGNQGWDDVDDYVFQGLDTDGGYSGDHAYQPFYFKMAGELTSASTGQLAFMGGNEAVAFKLEEAFEDGNNICPRPELRSDHLYDGTNEIDLSSSANHRAQREKTVTRNIYRTDGEMEKVTTDVPANLFNMNAFPALDNAVGGAPYTYGAKEDHHLAEFTETGADGSRYVYGIPVYADSTKEVMFAKNNFDEYEKDYVVPIDLGDGEASLGNDEEDTDHLYSSSETPGYAESFLLTQVVSPDYVDVTGNGLSEDDLGYYTKFNYVLVNESFKWRAPYAGAILNTGHLSDVTDDKASYMYGTKEIYLLHSIETKTHTACFFLKETPREDAHAAITELSASASYSAVASADDSWSLDHISLYSKADPDFGTDDATPIKSVYFNYDYSLCPGVPNNENSGNPSPDGGTGKLTLTGMYFTYRANNKGALSPYTFEYENVAYEDDLENPEYDPLGNDRWGTFQRQSVSSNVQNNENPYTYQLNRTRADQSAAAWCLKKIMLPSGSIVNIDYEADDYAFVQDKPAMQMCRVIGFGEEGISAPDLDVNVTEKLNKKNTRVYFELAEPIADGLSDPAKTAEVYKYLQGIEDMYFKLFLSLREPFSNPTGADLYDYVDGFCKIKTGSAGDYGVVDDNGSADEIYGYMTVELVDRDDYPSLSGAQVHPFEKAAWQYMYLERPDLFANPTSIAGGAISNLVSTLAAVYTELPRAVAPYITANVRGWGNKLDINTSFQQHNTRPSYIRLNSQNKKKIGGGHRVRTIRITDSWDAISTHAGQNGEYGQSYMYQLSDGTSSGVASYEPLMGGEENAMCLPLRYNSDNLVKKDGAFYVMQPLCESYYPAPVVGYSRVIVSSIVADDEDDNPVTVSRTGKTEYEFYTAKDYPVKSDRTDLQKTWFPIPVEIPFVGGISYNMRGFSQGYSVVLNDMHGKLKAVSTYPAYANLTATSPMPTRRVCYKYNGGYEANKSNELNSTVDVLTADGVYAEANLGETYDFFFDLRQHSNETQDLGGQFNLTVNPAVGTIPSFLPSINISKSLYRSAVAMKVIYRTGILTEVETMDDGAKSTARNLMFDAETGAPLLTVVENEFEHPVYSYNYAAHWAYEGMQGAYKNEGMRFNGYTLSAGVLTVADADQYFFPGDEVMHVPSTGPGKMLWVSSVSSGSVLLMDETGTDAGGLSGNFVIHRSGRRNLQSVSNGVIVSLSNPVTDRNYPLFDAFNSFSGSITEILRRWKISTSIAEQVKNAISVSPSMMM